MSVQDIATLTPGSPALTPAEQAIAALWCEVLVSNAPVQPTDNFFALGGDSLAMTMVLFRIKEELGLELPPGALLEAPDLRSFCAVVESLRG